MPGVAKTKRPRRSTLEDDVVRVADDDGGTDGDCDPCDRCECPRSLHDDGIGECVCGACRKFREPT